MRAVTMACDPGKIGLAIFSFNRPRHLETLYKEIHNLKMEGEYCFHLFNDGPKTTETLEIRHVRKLTDQFVLSTKNFELTRNTQNLGLAKSIRLGLNSLFAIHRKAMILEDDIIPTKAFFAVMEYYLNTQEFNQSVGSVTGANTTRFPLLERRDFLLSKRHSSWGWATWADRWLSIDWDYVDHEFVGDQQTISKVRKASPDLVEYAKLQAAGKIDSWATAMNIDFIRKGLLCIVPKKNLITNIGLDGSGTHGSKSMLNKQLGSLIKEPELKLGKFPKLEQSTFYDFLVRKDNSLMRNFPTSQFIIFLVKMKKLFHR
jgi:hypothetical protein